MALLTGDGTGSYGTLAENNKDCTRTWIVYRGWVTIANNGMLSLQFCWLSGGDAGGDGAHKKNVWLVQGQDNNITVGYVSPQYGQPRDIWWAGGPTRARLS